MLISLLCFCIVLVVLYQLACHGYWQHVAHAQAQVHNTEHQRAPGKAPQPIVGNLLDIYQADNQLSAYNALHHEFGAVVQILWLWRYQLSVASYPMARYILGENQYCYEKFPPNALLRKLYGNSVLTNNGAQWKRHRLILNEFFTEKAVVDYHGTIEQFTQQLIQQWQASLSDKTENLAISAELKDTAEKVPAEADIDLCQDFNALFLDIITQITVGHSVGALEANADDFLTNLAYIIKASTKPQYQFVSWWQTLPLRQNYLLSQALNEVDAFLENLISQHQAVVKQKTEGTQRTILRKLLKASEETLDCPLTHTEVKDNLLAIIGNGYETVATTLSMTLQALVHHPEALEQATQEAQSVIERYGQQLTSEAVMELTYLEAVLYESMRLYPAVAGLQRVSLAEDVLDDWSIPTGQAVGVTLQPLHLDSQYYGEEPTVFNPDRYLQHASTQKIQTVSTPAKQETASASRCPFARLGLKEQTGKENSATVLPLTFGYGSRQCLAKHLALYEMKIVLAMLLNAFKFECVDDTTVELELGKFGLFISAHPKTPITLRVSSRIGTEKATNHKTFQNTITSKQKALVYQ